MKTYFRTLFGSLLVAGGFLFLSAATQVFAECNDVAVEGYQTYCDFNNDGSYTHANGEAFFSDCDNPPASVSVGDRCCRDAAECTGAATNTPTPPTAPTTPASGPDSNPVEPLTEEFFNLVDPLEHGGGQTIVDDVASPYADQLKTPGGIISRALTFAFPLAGMILFVMLVWSGFEILVTAPTKKSIDAGKQRATAALIGFLLLFATYWIFQIIETVFGVKIL